MVRHDPRLQQSSSSTLSLHPNLNASREKNQSDPPAQSTPSPSFCFERPLIPPPPPPLGRAKNMGAVGERVLWRTVEHETRRGPVNVVEYEVRLGGAAAAELKAALLASRSSSAAGGRGARTLGTLLEGGSTASSTPSSPRVRGGCLRHTGTPHGVKLVVRRGRHRSGVGWLVVVQTEIN